MFFFNIVGPAVWAFWAQTDLKCLTAGLGIHWANLFAVFLCVQQVVHHATAAHAAHKDADWL